MVTKGWERIRKFYFIWTIASLTLLYFIDKHNLEKYLLLLVIIFLLNDLFIDMGYLRIFYKRYRKSPWPDWFEHAPMVALITLGGLFSVLEISKWTVSLAFVDTIIDVLNDLKIK